MISESPLLPGSERPGLSSVPFSIVKSRITLESDAVQSASISDGGGHGVIEGRRRRRGLWWNAAIDRDGLV